MIDVVSNIALIEERINEAVISCGRNRNEVEIVAVTKTVDPDLVNIALQNGIKIIGENRIQEFLEKKDNYIQSSRSFIGTLQRNKAKDAVRYFDLIESVDSIKLAKQIDAKAGEMEKIQDILIEVNIGGEESKGGIIKDELSETLNNISENFSNLRVKGLMAIPPPGTESEVRADFYAMQKLFIDNRAKKYDNIYMDILSMGMSDDFTYAIKEGATRIRIGSLLFGRRNY